MKKCIYCGAEIPSESVIDFCRKCGVNVWGEKMFNTIVQNMEDARSRGDLCHSNSPQTIGSDQTREKIGVDIPSLPL